MYCDINLEFIEINLHGKASHINSLSISTASFIISTTFFFGSCFCSFQWIREDCGCKHHKKEAEYYSDTDTDTDADTDTNEVVVDAVLVL